MPYYHDSYHDLDPGTDWDQIEEIYYLVKDELEAFYIESKRRGDGRSQSAA